MVVDCGGGTVDITVHELAGPGGRLRELYRASGGPHGSVGEGSLSEICDYYPSSFSLTLPDPVTHSIRVQDTAQWLERLTQDAYCENELLT